jgi:hypothetical protein
MYPHVEWIGEDIGAKDPRAGETMEAGEHPENPET